MSGFILRFPRELDRMEFIKVPSAFMRMDFRRRIGSEGSHGVPFTPADVCNSYLIKACHVRHHPMFIYLEGSPATVFDE